MSPRLLETLRLLMAKEDAGELFDRVRDGEPDGSLDLAILMLGVRNEVELAERGNKLRERASPALHHLRWGLLERLRRANGRGVLTDEESRGLERLTDDEREVWQTLIDEGDAALEVLMRAMREQGASTLSDLRDGEAA